MPDTCCEPFQTPSRPFQRAGEPQHSSGDVLQGLPVTSTYQSRAAQLAQADLELELHVDVKTAARIRELHNLKQQAVQDEDYDEAQRLKESILRIRQLGSKIAQLEAQKAVCSQIQSQCLRCYSCSNCIIDRVLTSSTQRAACRNNCWCI
jgi:multidrug efflux pump subunit AcrA (membrane-fusion protein)